MNTFGQIYLIIWSIGAIILGVIGLFFRRWFLRFCEKGYAILYKKTNFFLFEKAAKEFTKPYMNLLVIFLGLVFLAVGIITLFNNIFI